jgi:hypothetical protein
MARPPQTNLPLTRRLVSDFDADAVSAGGQQPSTPLRRSRSSFEPEADRHNLGVMAWRALIEGDIFDLEALSVLFPAGDPLVAQSASGTYYLESVALEDSKGQIDLNAARALIKRINGIGRVIDPGYQPVLLTDQYTASDGSVTVALPTATLRLRPKLQATAVVTRNGVPVPPPPPKAPRYAKLAEQDSEVADALRVLGQPDPLDWYDIYKVWEIVEHAVGGSRQVEKRGWVTKADIDRLTASANHPGISGDEARHARMKGTPGAKAVMSMSEADSLVRRLVANWIESHASF